jgi:perosamine synthetase
VVNTRVSGYVAPAGTRIATGELIRGMWGSLSPRKSLATFQRRLCELTGTSRCWSFSSGRAALAILLRTMRRARGETTRTQVIVPAYTCYSVAGAVARAGLEIRLCDVDAATLGVDLDSLARIDTSRVLAVMSTSLYGLPDPLSALESFARERGIYFIDDAAQALGAELDGRRVGGFGDAGILSFGKGKCITSMSGGAIVSRDGALAEAIEAEYAGVPEASALSAAVRLAQLPTYALLLRPRAYGLVRNIPSLELGVTRYDADFGIERFPPALAGIGAELCDRLADLNASRRARERQLREGLRDIAGLRMPQGGGTSTALRAACLVESPLSRDAVVTSLDQAGIGASASYPRALCDVPEVRRNLSPDDLEMRGARRVAAGIMTLPTHDFCPPDLAQRVRAAIVSAGNLPAVTDPKPERGTRHNS